jgi:hypothetical protein
MAEGVVDAFQRVEIEKEQGSRLAPPPISADGPPELLLQLAAVRQARQRVVVGEVAHPLLGALALRDVDIHANQADDATVHHHRRQYRLHLAPAIAIAVYGFVAQGLAAEDLLVRFRPGAGDHRIDVTLARQLADMRAPMFSGGAVVHDVAPGGVADPEVERQALDRGA